MNLGCGAGGLFAVELSSLEYGEDDVAASPRQADDRGVVILSLGALLRVVIP